VGCSTIGDGYMIKEKEVNGYTERFDLTISKRTQKYTLNQETYLYTILKSF
jgi:hypothetical protein